jgi:outer membrane protein assembly factor BamB
MTLEKGREIWDVKIAGDLISAPIIDKGSVYITCFDGTVYRYDKSDGELVWSKKKQATCAPTIYNEKIYLSLRQEKKEGDTLKQYEGMATLDLKDGNQKQAELWSKKEAPYLAYGRTTAKMNDQAELDASVGFGSVPSAAKLDQAKNNIGMYSVAGCWAYQGSRPVIKNGYSYNAMGNEIQALDIDSGKQKWSKKYDDFEEEGIGGRVFSPPSYANEKLFIGSGSGDVFCLREKDGKLLWKEKIEGSISFQPAVANGMIFVSCDNGMLYGIDTNDKNDDGWYMWGGNSEHNK